MTAYCRPFTVTEHDGGWLVTVGYRQFRLNKAEAEELARIVSGRPYIMRYPADQ
ncbi:hypothetical protein [Mycolicibacterium celeriflavum]|uniref:Uncharacterized protein n=1 Tax=Mycolicibacterium celeriflavum TaxID=1249101 RepID=A0A7I7RFD0_MYCCF|nr:hypothetical protein [Mycolicibacterium celeriflavum]MCV7239556.1 hypothetical protein [Mycolicibacterium celeriflavum]BBY43248.1 hypothetical protein MCEL_15430 [Mycolicibacterium celeriflavum]